MRDLGAVLDQEEPCRNRRKTASSSYWLRSRDFWFVPASHEHAAGGIAVMKEAANRGGTSHKHDNEPQSAEGVYGLQRLPPDKHRR
jgi:hypothetical protein